MTNDDGERRDPFHAGLDGAEREAKALHDALQASDDGAAWRFKWQHPRFHDRHVDTVRAAVAELDLDDARLVVAHDFGFASWDDLAAFCERAQEDGPVRTF